MVRLISVLCLCVMFPRGAGADSLVTWEATGLLTGSVPSGFGAELPRPPLGTPYTLSLTFDPSAAVPTPLGLSPDCMTVPLSGSLTLGATTYTTTGLGFTHAMLTGSNCTGSDFTQFSLHGSWSTLQDDPWDLAGSNSILIASYVDLLNQDGFAGVPTGQGGFWLQYFQGFNIRWEVTGPFAPQVVDADPPAPIPEPGTMMLFGIGLAAIARRIRAQRSPI